MSREDRVELQITLLCVFSALLFGTGLVLALTYWRV